MVVVAGAVVIEGAASVAVVIAAALSVSVSVSVAASVVVVDLVSSASGGSAGSACFAGGDALFGKLAFDNVGELVDCVGLSGGVPDVVEDC